MTFQKSIIFVLFLFVITEVVSWTIDLPEVRKNLFEHHDRHKSSKMEKFDNDYEMENRNQKFYSNIEGNSKHNTIEDKKRESYEDDSDEFEQSYMEKKMQDIVHDGGRYLEGLRIALEEFITLIEECKRNKTNVSQGFAPPVLPSPPNMTVMFNTTMTPFSNFNASEWRMRMGQRNFTGTNMNNKRGRMSCREATEASEKVRQYANLAVWATKRLQDLAYAKEYQKTDYYEENELILKLAWFLDQLAILTGYEPDYRRYIPVRTTPVPTTSPVPITLVPQNQELINYLVTCMKSKSTLAAPERCMYTPPLPALTPEASTTPLPLKDRTMITPSPADSVSAPSMELLITSDANRTPRRIIKRSTHQGHEYFVPIGVHEKPKPVVDFFVKKLSSLKAIVKSVKKHALADFSNQLAMHKHMHKRAIDDKMSMYSVLNRLSNALSDKSSDKSDDPIVKTEASIDNSDNISVKNDKSIVKSDLPLVKEGDIIVVSPIHYPMSDVSVVNTKSFKKRSINENSFLTNKLSNINSQMTATVKSIKKRAVNEPLDKFVSYYLKYKTWDAANQINNNSPTNYEVSNNLPSKVLAKRSIFHKKNSHFKIFKTLQMFKNFKKYSFKKGKSKLLSYMNDLLKKKRKFSQKSLHKIYKRSLNYERMYLPRIPTNPTGDISYYVKNKRGRNYNPNLVQAGLVRLSLQRTFENGNIAIIHRYGSNYNPAVPNTFAAGILRTAADS